MAESPFLSANLIGQEQWARRGEDDARLRGVERNYQIVTSTTRPTSPTNGMQIYETDTGRVLLWNGTSWTHFRLAGEPDAIYGLVISNGTATSFTDFFTVSGLATLSYPYTMHVTAHMNSGANGAPNIVTVQVRDESGVHIAPKTVIDGSWRQDNVDGSAKVWSVTAYKDYAAGATCGCRLAYKVSTSNIYLDGFVRISFHPRPG